MSSLIRNVALTLQAYRFIGIRTSTEAMAAVLNEPARFFHRTGESYLGELHELHCGFTADNAPIPRSIKQAYAAILNDVRQRPSADHHRRYFVAVSDPYFQAVIREIRREPDCWNRPTRNKTPLPVDADPLTTRLREANWTISKIENFLREFSRRTLSHLMDRKELLLKLLEVMDLGTTPDQTCHLILNLALDVSSGGIGLYESFLNAVRRLKAAGVEGDAAFSLLRDRRRTEQFNQILPENV